MAKFLRQYEILYKKSKIDLNTAKVVLEAFENGNIELELNVIFFHLQQCAEKLIKSYLDFHCIKFPHTHDLKNLIDIMEENNISFIEEKDFIVILTQYAVEGRYAIIHDDLDDADKYIKILDELLEFVEKEIKL
ncbi:MAG: HEPN domain-containing protein [Sulfurimonas sp.]|nr:HEPN domain-containing protein [Sulfurimonas sp.]